MYWSIDWSSRYNSFGWSILSYLNGSGSLSLNNFSSFELNRSSVLNDWSHFTSDRCFHSYLSLPRSFNFYWSLIVNFYPWGLDSDISPWWSLYSRSLNSYIPPYWYFHSIFHSWWFNSDLSLNWSLDSNIAPHWGLYSRTLYANISSHWGLNSWTFYSHISADWCFHSSFHSGSFNSNFSSLRSRNPFSLDRSLNSHRSLLTRLYSDRLNGRRNKSFLDISCLISL